MDIDITIITTVVSAIASAIGGGSFVSYRERKKREKLLTETKKIENEILVAGEWKKIYERSDADSREKDKKIDQLYETISAYRDRESAYRDRENEYTTRIAVLELKTCNIRGCNTREPKTGY